MGSRNYPRLDVVEFGQHLLETGDLDPVYIALHNVPWSREQVYRWLVAYWCLYHCGAASYISQFEGKHFWNKLSIATKNSPENMSPKGGPWPRGSERRHFRGKDGIRCVRKLSRKYPQPEYMIDTLCAVADETKEYEPVAEAVKEHYLFGPWMAFKIVDMIERVLSIPINFENSHVFMFSTPVKGALLVYDTYLADRKPIQDNAEKIEVTVEYMQEVFGEYWAPPRSGRRINIQEIETILCKWKSHMGGHYPLNNDIDEIHEGLKGWGKEADSFTEHMPGVKTPTPTDKFF